MGAGHQPIGGLEHWGAQQAEGQLLVVDLGGAGHVFDAGQAAQAGDRDQHFENQVNLIDFFDRRLHIKGDFVGVETTGQLIDNHVADVLFDAHDFGFVGFGGQGVQIGDDEIAFIVVLQA